MDRRILVVFALLIGFAAPLFAQQAPAPPQPEPPPEVVTEPAPPPPRTMVGTWEFSNADREKTCAVGFKNDPTKVGKKVEFDPACAALFPFVNEVAGWRQNDGDFLRLLDAKGNSVLEFSEVEAGIFEAPKTGEGILFLQNPTDLGPAPKTAEQITGEWSISRRTGRPLCTMTLSNEQAGEEFAIRLQPPCDPLIVKFGPATWTMDRGEIVIHSAGGQFWRFGEGEDSKWRRIPETATPLLMVRK